MSSEIVWGWIGGIVGGVIWFFLNRASVRADRQVELLESINKKLSILAGQDDSDSKHPSSKSSKSVEEITAEARKKAGLS